MNRFAIKFFIPIFLAVLVLALASSTAYASTSSDVVIGNNYTLNSGETLNDDLLILGGNVTLLGGSTVNGNLILLGGNLQAAGTVNGDVIVLGGSVDLTSSFILIGNLSTAGASVKRAPGAQITGEVYNETDAPRIFTLPGGIWRTNLSTDTNPLLGVAGFFLRLFIWVLVAIVVAMFIPTQLNRTSQTALKNPVASGGMGCLTAIVAPIVIVILAITICLIPAALLGIFLLAVAWAFGLIAFGMELGKRISSMVNRQWSPAISAGLGTLILMTILNGLDVALPCIGWLPKALVGLLGLGSVLLTQFGTKFYPPTTTLPPENPVEVLPPQDSIEIPPTEEPLADR